ncbi:class I SAM-dependent methyltransferase [uncultured Methanomethylovorans sp.]|uniref:class I SAM-dependent methyltransferase n=1 Tax=uncultured Methanomethylovorans sp. TaxID=183759 RepID=UPI002AA62953|nr:class I SAM-dependent methyltransferase [uncultured Methanomethylovorans sp.]
MFNTELEAIKKMLGQVHPKHRCIEIGVGTGRFTEGLHIIYGLDPSIEMLKKTRERKIICIQAVAENLPFKDKSFDIIMMATVDCFLTNLQQAFAEIDRTLKPDGRFILAKIDRDSELGKAYEKKQQDNRFYRYAKFHSVDEISEYIHEANFGDLATVQTLFRSLEMIEDVEPVRCGYGEGGFVVLGEKKEKMTVHKYSKINIS